MISDYLITLKLGNGSLRSFTRDGDMETRGKMDYSYLPTMHFKRRRRSAARTGQFMT